MSLQSNGRNHNYNPMADSDDVGFAKLIKSDKTTEQSYTELNMKEEIDLAAPVDHDEAAIMDKDTNSKASAYDDLDDYVFRQSKSSRKRKHRNSLFKTKSKHKHRKKRFKKWQKACIGIISTLLALIILLISTVVCLNMLGKSELTNADNLSIAVPDNVENYDNGLYITYKGNEYKYNENIATILCMGIDKETLGNVDGHIGTGGNADALFLITIDTETGDTNLVNISRETMTDIGIYSSEGNYIETQKAQICLAYAYGDGAESSCRNELDAVKKLFYNVPINSYLSLDLQGIGEINDAMGGVTVVSPETIGTFVAGETYTLKGSQAQSFVRNRSHETVEGNNLRMERQRVYLESFASSLISQTKKDITTPINIFNVAQPYICTNLNASKITHLAITAIRGGYNEFHINSVPGKVKKGNEFAEFYVDEDKFFEMFLSLYYKPVEDLE